MADTQLHYITQPTAEQIDRYAAIVHESFLMPIERAKARLHHQPQAVRILTAGQEVIGGLAVLDDAQRIGGADMRSWGIALVAIAPHWRGRGRNAGRSLMQHAVREAQAAGIPMMSLFASTPAFYRRLGFEIAGRLIHWRAPLHKLTVRTSDAIIEPVDPANLADVLAAHAAAIADATGPMTLRSDPMRRATFTPNHIETRPYRIRFGDSVEGYMVIELSREGGRLNVWRQAMATRRAAQAALNFFAEYRTLYRHVEWPGGPADPLRLLIDANATHYSSEEWFTRLLNVEAALLQRRYPPVHCELHLDITDDLLPRNAGRCVLSIRNGQPTLQRGGTGRIALDIRALAPIYCSHLSPVDLQRLGMITAPADDLHALAIAFTAPAPYMLDRF